MERAAGSTLLDWRLRDVDPTGYVSIVSDSGSSIEGPRLAVDQPLGRAGVEILAAVPLFSKMSKRRLRSLSDRAMVVGYGPDRIVLGEGVRGGGSMFVLLEGTVRVVAGSRTIKRLGPGDVFGEMALLDGRPRSASVVAVSPIVAARLARTAFLDLVRSDPDIAFNIMEILATRLRDCQGRSAL
jgi:CRP/FNR family cyclic AMP-dependent transcriptional regulator